MKNRYLTPVIINADDFGISIGTNRGIEKAHKRGILTSVSIMPSGHAFDDAILVARRNRKLGVGIHLSLTWGTACLSKKEIPDLVDEENYFYPSLLGIILKVLIFKYVRIQIKNEFNAQVKRVLESGIRPDHFNGQVHVHFLPYIFPIVLSLAKKYKVNYVRVPLEPLFAAPSLSSFIKWSFLQIMGLILRIQGQLPKNNVSFFGVLFTSLMSKKIIKKIVLRKNNFPLEILSHPGEHNLGRTSFKFTKQRVDDFLLNKNRLFELRTLMDKDLVSFIKKRNIILTTFRKLNI